MIVVADASPLIFLAKIRRLDRVHVLLGRDIRIPKAVRDEVVARPLDPAEEHVLNLFLDVCRVETVRRPRTFASGHEPRG